ncbi:MAG: C39 family peptidase [Archangium sp.]|nr:C39 family peptidase [Archangium sp.]
MHALLPLVLVALPSVQLEGFQHVKQKPDFCGEADVEMALRRLGRDIDQDDVFNASGLDPLKGRGIWADDLKKVLTTLGFEPGQTWYRVNPAKSGSEMDAQFAELHKDLSKGIPSIVCMHYDAQPKTTEHFRLITGYDARTDEVVYMEPAEDDGANRRMKRADFLALWPFKPAKDKWTVIRLRLEEKSKPELQKFTKPTPAEVVQHVMELKETMPSGFTMVWEKPFLVIGNESPEKVRSRAKDVVGWTRDLLLKDYFPKAPETMEDVWVFKDAATYEKYSRELFQTEPDTPYGFYLSSRKSMVMNIRPGYGTLTHELVHPFMHANWPEGPAWFNEGLGSLFEFPGERDGHFIGQLNWRLPGVQTAIREKTVPKISALVKTTEDQFYDDDSGVHYAMARYLCYWLQEKGLLIKFVKRAQELKGEDKTGLKALTEVLGGDPDTFQKEWEKFTLALKRRSS